MEFKNKLQDLKGKIQKESEYGPQATSKAKGIIDEMLTVATKKLNQVTGKAPTNITKHFSGNFGRKGFATQIAKGKVGIHTNIDSIKSELVLNRFFDNTTKQWFVNKLNMLKRL